MASGDGGVARIESISAPYRKQCELRNIEVEETHQFKVGDLPDGIWTHNGMEQGCRVPKAATPGKSQVGSTAAYRKNFDDVFGGNNTKSASFRSQTNSEGLPTRSEGVISGPHPGRKKGTRPDPVGGRDAGHHRGHLVPENLVDDPAVVNIQSNIISEAARSNLSGKKIFENLAGRIATENPNSVVKTIHFPKRRPGETVPFAVTHYITVDDVVVHSISILNK